MRFLSKVSNKVTDKVFGDLCIFLIQYLVEIFTNYSLYLWDFIFSIIDKNEIKTLSY